jgi:iron complex outermembrane receptor protein
MRDTIYRSTIAVGVLATGLIGGPGASAQRVPAAAAAIVEATDDATPEPDGDDLVVTGNRRATEALAGTSPVDVVSREAIEQGGAITLQQTLFRAAPSFNFPQGAAARVGGGATRSASLRGQNPDLTLVLVDGKRRHGSVATGGTFPYGGAGYADINTIPVAALSRVEILLDGASAQYGGRFRLRAK